MMSDETKTAKPAGLSRRGFLKGLGVGSVATGLLCVAAGGFGATLIVPNPDRWVMLLRADWLESLVQGGDISTLSGIGELAQDALSRVRHEAPQAALQRQA